MYYPHYSTTAINSQPLLFGRMFGIKNREVKSVRFFGGTMFGYFTEEISTLVENSNSAKIAKKSKKPLAFLKNMSYNEVSE